MAKTFGNKVGTPRGYVDKEARDKVDEAMQPIAEVGKELLYLTPMGRAARGAKTVYEGGKAIFKGATKQATKEVAKDATKSVARRGGGAAGAPRPARGVKPDSMRQQTLDSLKQGPKKPEKAADMKSGGARANALKEAKAASKGGTRKPQPGDKNFVGPTKPRTFGSMSRGQKIAAGAAAAGAGAMLYKGADKPQAGGGVRSAGPAGRDDRASSGSGSSKADAFRKKRQGMNTPGSPTNPNKAGPKKAGDKSRAAAKPEKKMSNFERMKQRQYEKEGYGGRSMTPSKAKSRVQKERSFKFKDLFKKK